MFEKIIEIGLLFDFYGKLLSKRQYTVVDLYYIHDLSLSEIGEQLEISRQGVYDLLKRAENHLYNHEKQLGLVEKFNRDREKLKIILEYIHLIDDEALKLDSSSIIDYCEKIKDISFDILEISQEGKQ